MSNCVDISNDVVLTPDQFDLQRLIADVASAPIAPPVNVDQDDPAPYFFSWFVKGALVTEGDNLVWRAGQGASSHTFRDLKGTCWCLANYWKLEGRPTFKFYLRDSDDNSDWGWYTYSPPE